MKDPDLKDGIWEFYDTVKAFPRNETHWSSDNIIAEFNVGLSHPGGGTMGEFSILFYKFGHKRNPDSKVAARLVMFTDAMDALTEIDLIERLAALDEWKQGPDEVRALLLDMGMVDKTAKLRGTDPAHCLTCNGKGVMDDVAPSTRVEAL